MRRLSYTLIRASVGAAFEAARAEWLCDCGARITVIAPDDFTPPACRACDVAYRRFMARTMSTTFKAKDFRPLPAG